MKREEWVDYFAVADGHLAIHARLEQWARWVRVRPHGWQTAPMFRQYRSHAWQWETPEVRAAVNTLDAVAMERAVSALPQKNRDAIRWCYVLTGNPLAMARRLGVSRAGLMELVESGRTMLVNRSER